MAPGCFLPADRPDAGPSEQNQPLRDATCHPQPEWDLKCQYQVIFGSFESRLLQMKLQDRLTTKIFHGNLWGIDVDEADLSFRNDRDIC